MYFIGFVLGVVHGLIAGYIVAVINNKNKTNNK